MSNSTSLFADTRSALNALGFDPRALEAWMALHVEGFEGPLNVEKLSGSFSNLTFKLTSPCRAYVMRARPGSKAKLPPSADPIERAFCVMNALVGTDVPVPTMHAMCGDEAVIGRTFDVREYVEGRVLWDPSLPGMSTSERAAIYHEMNRVIAALHSIDYEASGLTDFDEPGSYLARQIKRWSRRYRFSKTEPIPAMDALMTSLPRYIPHDADEQVCIVHGDYTLNNLIFHPTEARVLAVLGWELSTLGDPMADFSYHCMVRHITPGLLRGMAGVDTASLGIPDEAIYRRAYAQRTGRTVSGDWYFYLAFNMFKVASNLQGIMKRVVDGTASSAQTIEIGRLARPMAEKAWRYLQMATR